MSAGYLNFIFRIDDITAAIQDYSGLGNTGETVIESQDVNGNAISLFPLRFDTDAALKTNLNSLSLATNVNADFRQATDYRGSEVLLTARAIGFANWVLATKIDMDEALAPINQLRTIMFTIVGVSSLIIILFSLYLTQFFIAPILRVVQVSRNYGRGDFSSRVGFQGTDEIGMLGASINAMGSSLQETVSHLEAQRNRLTVILNSTAESIMAIDKSGNIVLANAATETLTHLPEREIVNRNIADVFHFKKNMQLFAVDYNKPGTNIYPDLELVDANETVHYLKLIVAQVNTSNSATSSSPQTIVTIHDETRSRELENMKVDFVSMAAHELRTPLAATRGYLELISFKEGAGIPADVKNYLQQALKSTNELGDLIDNLLGVTRIERGTLTLHPEKVDIAADIQQAIQGANFAANDKRIAITYDGPTSGCFVLADQIALHEVVNNLISNAIKYTNPGGEVTILLGRETDHYVISFKDTGIGIPKQAMQNLFTKFYRVRGGLNSGSTGTGLGLFIAKSIIERHGGSISVESQEGVGSTFTVTIPVLNDQQYADLQASNIKLIQQREAVAGLRKILLVEDNVELRKMYETFLKLNGYTVAVAATATRVEVARTFLARSHLSRHYDAQKRWV